MDKEIAKERVKVAEQERLANVVNDGVVVVEVDGEPLLPASGTSDKPTTADELVVGKRAVDFHPNALHDPDSPHPAQAIHHVAAVHSSHSSHGHTPTSPHSCASPHGAPMLDLRGNSGKTHGDCQHLHTPHTRPLRPPPRTPPARQVPTSRRAT